MAKHPEKHEDKAVDPTAPAPEAQAGSISEQAAASPPGETEGVRARRAFMMKQFLPNPDWINANVVSKGQGTRATIGRIFGMATGAVRSSNEYKGKTIESVHLRGTFRTQNYLTGEIAECSVVYFPNAYSEQVETMFLADKEMKIVEVDVDVGLEATGKTIPYEWVIVAFLEGDEMAVMKRLRNSRKPPASLLVGPKGEQLQLTGPAKTA